MTNGVSTTPIDESALSLTPDAGRYLSELSPSHAPMVKHIAQVMPAMRKDIAVFGRRQSQFMDAALTCSHQTPIRNLRQVLSEIHRAMSALHEAMYSMKKREIRAKVKDRKADATDDELKAEYLRVEAAELRSQNDATMQVVSGSIRKVRALSDQRDAILKRIKKDHLTEADFEADESRYHVMRAFEQALCAARSRGGSIDEGNHIYLCQLGINGTLAQMHISERMEMERKMLSSDKKVPGVKDYHAWLEGLADAYAGLSGQRMTQTGMLSEASSAALLTEGSNYE